MDYDREVIRMDKQVARLKNNMAKELLAAGVDTARIQTFDCLDRYLRYAYTVGYEQCLRSWQGDVIDNPLKLGS